MSEMRFSKMGFKNKIGSFKSDLKWKEMSGRGKGTLKRLKNVWFLVLWFESCFKCDSYHAL